MNLLHKADTMYKTIVVGDVLINDVVLGATLRSRRLVSWTSLRRYDIYGFRSFVNNKLLVSCGG